MNEDMSDMIKSVKRMVDSGNIPENIKEMIGNINNSNPEIANLLNNVSSKTTSNNTTSNNFGSGLDVETIMKMKSIIENINKKDDPRANLLYSLKPYLRESRKDKLDQYVNLLNMTKIAEIMTNEKRENNNGTKQ